MVWKPHTTVAAIVEDDGHFLMVRENTDQGEAYNQPAGHLEDNETLLEAVVRETREETAWSITPQSLVGIYQWKNPVTWQSFLRVCFHARQDAFDATRSLDKDIIEALWMTRKRLCAEDIMLRSPMVLRCIDDFLGGARYPLSLLNRL
jgi:ADP-ribose pyrophosphatase YjhB (NUDIX family)